jgi:hypothetical protein
MPGPRAVAAIRRLGRTARVRAADTVRPHMAARLVAVRLTAGSREEAVEDPRSTARHRTILRPPAVEVVAFAGAIPAAVVAVFTAGAIPAAVVAVFTAAAIPAVEVAAFTAEAIPAAAVAIPVADIRVGDTAKTLRAG